MSYDKASAERMELAFKAVEFRQELDALCEKHGVRPVIGWEGKTVKLQLQFIGHPHVGVTIMETRKGGRVKYVTEVEENTRTRP